MRNKIAGSGAALTGVSECDTPVAAITVMATVMVHGCGHGEVPSVSFSFQFI